MARNQDLTLLRRAGRAALRLMSVPVGLAIGYGLAATIGGAIPVNSAWRAPAEGVRIYVVDGGVHTDLVLPASADWNDLLRPEDLADPAMAVRSHVAFGWGDRDFYLNTPSWSRIDLARAASALVGAGRSVLHVAHVDPPGPAPEVHALTLRPEEYRRLVAFVRATFVLNGGRATSVRGYGGGDAFYEARGGYSAINTCNQWTGGALRAAGVRLGAWTPLTFTVIEWL